MNMMSDDRRKRQRRSADRPASRFFLLVLILGAVIMISSIIGMALSKNNSNYRWSLKIEKKKDAPGFVFKKHVNGNEVEFTS